MPEAMIEGIHTAIITPFVEKGFGIQERTWRALIERQIEAKINGIVVAGSTGEGQTLYSEEWETALQIACEYRDKIQIMASVGSSATWQSIDRLKRAQDLGAHSCLVSTPPYNKPTQEGLFQHFESLHQASPNMPLVIYNIPGRTAVNLQASTLQRLWKIPSVSAIKESSGDWSQFLEMMEACPKDKSILSGDDPSALAFWTHGSTGLVSVMSNVFPRIAKKLWDLFQDKKYDEAKNLFYEALPYVRLLFIESNPIPTKWILSKILKTDLPVRLPLTELSLSYQEKLLSTANELKEKAWV